MTRDTATAALPKTVFPRNRAVPVSRISRGWSISFIYEGYRLDVSGFDNDSRKEVKISIPPKKHASNAKRRAKLYWSDQMCSEV